MTLTGDVLAGRYRLVHRVATGGMGTVWEAWDELLQRPVAIKELLSQPTLREHDAAMARNRVIREARITARLHHPHAVTLYDVIDHGGQPCLVLQFVPSRTLSSMLKEQGSLPVAFVIGVGAEIASALAAAHEVGIVHRDVKPSNVLITAAGAAMITDFGISHAVGDVTLTSTGMVSGTPAFLAPEVARGARSGFPADVFSLGATLYTAVEGAPPFGADQNAMALLHKVASGQITPPQRSGRLTDLLHRMLATDPAARPAMSEVARLLAGLRDQKVAPASTSELPTAAVPPPTAREWLSDHDPGRSPAVPTASPLPLAASAPPNGRSRRRLTLLLIAAAVVLLAGVGTWLLVAENHPAQPTASKGSVSAPLSLTSGAVTTDPSRSTSHRPTSSRTVATSARPTSSSPVSRAVVAEPSTSGAPARQATRPTVARTSAVTTSPAARTSSATSRTSTTPASPSPSALAAAITDYYAMLPGDTDQGWAHLTSKFQNGTAHDRQYYQRFWDGVGRVTASDAKSTGPDTVQATITYYFKDGRTVVEPTVYTLVSQNGILKIDDSNVLSSTTQ